MSTLSRRCFSQQPITGESARIEGSEAHHLLHVLRVKPGDAMTLFDGSGMEFAAEATDCGRKEVDFKVGAGQVVDRELAAELTVGVAMPKGDRARWLVEKLVELGATRLAPLRTQYDERKTKSESPEKLQRYVVEASKQCGRNRLMTIAQPQDFSEWLAQSADVRKLLAHPGGKPIAEVAGVEQSATCLSIGPEGGFADAEVQAAVAAGWQPIDLGPRILRIETAALALVAVLASHLRIT